MATAQVTRDPQLGFPPKGSLRRYPFARLVREAARNRLTGSLYLLNGQTKKVVFFEDGAPVFVRSNVLSECLGQVLSSEGLITQEQCEQTLEAIRRTGKKQGELLVEMGILSEGNLRYSLEAQLRFKLFDIFAWEDGRYQFKTDPATAQFGIRLSLSAEGVIIGAIQDRYSKDRAENELQPYDDKYPVLRGEVTDRGQELDLLAEEVHFAQCLDGSRTVNEVIAEAPDTLPTPRALLYGLLQSGLVQLSDKALPPQPRPPAPNLKPKRPPDKELAPDFEPQDVVTEYEDTPLPGELPKVRGLLGDHEADFAGVEDEEGQSSAPRNIEVSEALVAAEPEQVEETFDDDQIELNPEEDLEELDEDAIPLLSHADHEVSTLGGDGEGLAESSLAGVDEGTHADLQASDLTAASDSDQPATLETLDADLLASNADEDLADIDPLASVDDVELDNLDDVDLGGVDETMGDDLLAAEDIDAIDSIDAPLLEDDELDDVQLDAGDADLVLEQAEEIDEDALVGFDDLDAVSLDPDAPVDGAGPQADVEGDSPELLGAMRFNEAETALEEGDHARAVSLLEEAYENGFDVAELHAMLAYSRFMASDQSAQTATHSFELLDYAQNMDPSLDLVPAYRGAIYKILGQAAQAREALDRALELNPYCELAIELMDQL